MGCIAEMLKLVQLGFRRGTFSVAFGIGNLGWRLHTVAARGFSRRNTEHSFMGDVRPTNCGRALQGKQVPGGLLCLRPPQKPRRMHEKVEARGGTTTYWADMGVWCAKTAVRVVAGRMD